VIKRKEFFFAMSCKEKIITAHLCVNRRNGVIMNNTTTNNTATMLTAEDITMMFALVTRVSTEEFNEYLEEEFGFVDIPDVNDEDDIYI